MLSIVALAASGAFAVSASVYAAQPDVPSQMFRQVAVVGPSLGFGTADSRRDVIEPPSSIDPGMALDPPETGSRTPILRPQAPAPHGPVFPK
ncbi:MAG TPA: hypothetical protein VM782_09815 [Stellaceae bacterium]|nr:hypothetical protein [Stellaceae bacterium]